ncbi:MAG: serine/threonine protein kinase [Labilithrix sp.]|nr:serine/threonine protein kinase [Labilithrix sp.]MCW5810622.1 serine/threonine protein kinase [Labilithrix sp.]
MSGLSGAPRYHVVDEIAAGGMGVVYLALRTDPSGRCEPVAIKRLHEHLLDDQAMVDAFVDEARIASRLDHPNLVRVHDVTPLDAELVIVMDWVEGITLSSLLKKQPEPLPIPVVRRVLVDTLDGLHSAHELRDDGGAPLNVVHRDISPQNMLVGSDGRTRLTDFGIALARGRLAPTTVQGVKGKLPYLSPEQINRAPLDRRCDLFAFGAVAWELLARRRLFRAGTEAETLAMILRDPIPPPSSERMEVPLDLDETILRALERKPERRFESADAFARAIEEGGPLAPREDVGRLVIAAVGTTLAARRQKLSHAMERPAPPRLLREELTATVLAPPPPPPPRPAASLAMSISPPPEPAPSRSSTPMVLGVVVALLLAIGLVVKYKEPTAERPPRFPDSTPAPPPEVARTASLPSLAPSIELPATPTPPPPTPPAPRPHRPARRDAGAARQPFMPDDL